MIETQETTRWSLRKLSQDFDVVVNEVHAELFWRMSSALVKYPTVEVFLAGVSTFMQSLCNQIPGKAQLVFLKSCELEVSEVVAFAPTGSASTVVTGLSDALAFSELGFSTGSFSRHCVEELGRDLDIKTAIKQLQGREQEVLFKLSETSRRIVFPVFEAQRLTAVVCVELSDDIAVEDEKESWLDCIAFIIASWGHFVVAREQNRTMLEQVSEENRYFRERGRRHYLFKELVCESAAMQAVYNGLNDFVGSDCPVLITGEPGTGKELLARALHHLGPRCDHMLISFNCGQLSGELLDFELFGCAAHELAGAITPRKGIFELADEGTVLLDEVDLLSPFIQSKLLRMLKDGEIRRIGDAATRHVRARVIMSMHGSPEKAVQSGRLRADLYEVLREYQLDVPPLRARQQEILPLAQQFLKGFSERYERQCEAFDEGFQQWLVNYAWPGNVRELQSFIESVVLRAGEHPTIKLEHLAFTQP